MPPDGHRSEGTRSLSEAPYVGAKPFGSVLAFEKGTRCKSETASGSTRTNGYASKPQTQPPKNQIKRPQPSATPTQFAIWQVNSVQTFNTFPPIATATNNTAISPNAKLKLLACATNPITAGPARIPA